MSASATPYERICPGCGRILTERVATCPECGTALESPPRRATDRGTYVLPFSEYFGTAFKVLVVLGLMAGAAWLVYRGYQAIWQDVVESNPYPADPCVTTTEFFTALETGQYQRCYELLSSDRKAAVVIGQQGRNTAYDAHFDRIAAYLEQRVGPDFAQRMQVSANGQEVVFDSGVLLTLKLAGSTGVEKKTHWAVAQVNEFPIDVAPGMGVEAHYRQVERAMGSLDQLNANPDAGTSEIVRRRDGESTRERFERLTEAFFTSRQLDVQHELLEWIVREFGATPQVGGFLSRVRDDEKVPLHLRRQAAAMIETWGL